MSRIYTILIPLFFLFLNVKAQSPYEGIIRLENQHVEKRDKEIYIDLNVVFDHFKLKPQQFFILNPQLLTKDSALIKEFDPITVVGNKRWVILNRAEVYNNESVEFEPNYVLRRREVLDANIPMNVVLPLNVETNGAIIKFEETISGCNNCLYDPNEPLYVNIPFFKTEYVFTVIYVVPEPEPVKQRDETYSAHINYEVNKFDLLRNFKNNAEILEEVSTIISELRNDPNMTINEFKVTGYASPEGNFRSNQILSENRANSFLVYLSGRYGFNTDIIQSEGKGEDWNGLREAVSKSSLEQKNEIIDIIDNTSDILERKRKIMALSGGATYRMLLKDYYPPLRRNDYTISYMVRPFDVEEAKEIIKTRPSLLSLNEMYLVAETYAKDSDEFKEVFDIATRIYPEDPVAKLNAAALDIENGAYDRAIQKLLEIDTPEAWNNLGVAYAKKEEIDLAKEYFRRAADMGIEQAIVNLNEFDD